VATSNRDKTFIYHLTAARNIPSIRRHGLLCRSELERLGISFRDVADDKILEGRARFDLDEMVPFHFIPRSPFDYSVVHAHPRRKFVLLGVRRTLAAEQGWSIIPRHPLSAREEPDVLDWEEGIDAIDWSQLDRHPRPYEDDRDCKLACMAEALCPRIVEFDEISIFFVPNEKGLHYLQRKLGDTEGLWVNVNEHMFPKGCR